MPIIGQISVGDGATFTPAVDNDGVISWSNNKNLPNPASVDIPQTVMDRYLIAPIASPAFTGNPTAPTQAKTDDSTKLATTAYVKAVVADYLELTGGSITGDVDITGDLSVTGTITGHVTGNVTGTASGNLALTGGTMTGLITLDGNQAINNAANDDYVEFNGGTGESTGAHLSLYGKDHATKGGNFTLEANDGVNSARLEGKPNGELKWNNALLVPTGVVQAFAGSTTPAGWLLCDGSAVSRTTYVDLFAVIGTTYGTGDGSTTFNLPNLTDKFIQGNSTSGTVKNAGLPNITGSATTTYSTIRGNVTGALYGSVAQDSSASTYSSPSFVNNVQGGKIVVDASKSNSIYGNSTTVQPPAVTMRYIIKY